MSKTIDSSFIDSYTYNINENDIEIELNFTLAMNSPKVDGEIFIDGEFYIL